VSASPTGKLFIVSAPSGSGKTTLCNKLLGDYLGLANSVSMTTRRPRPDEVEGIDYHFVSRKKFQKMIGAGEFLEYEENFGELYGTPEKFIANNLKSGKSVLLSIDVKGAMKVKRAYPDESVLIFILPPSVGTLKKRLFSRHSEDIAAIKRRVAFARKELSYKNRYDHRIVNNHLANAYKRLKDIILSELKKIKGDKKCRI
jgi:guanylate kinase